MRAVLLPLCAACALALPVFARAQSLPPAWSSPSMPVPGEVQGGTAPVAQALAKIIPPAYRIELDQSVPSSLKLTWRGGTNWMQILRNATAPVGLVVKPDWAYNTIEILRAAPTVAVAQQPAGAAQPPGAQPAPPLAAVTAGPFSAPKPITKKPAAKPVRAAEPHGEKAIVLPHPTTPVPPLSQLLALHAAKRTGTKPAHTANGLHTADAGAWPMSVSSVGHAYTIQAGRMLSAGLQQYVAQFGWTLQWQLPHDYPITAPLPVPALSIENGTRYVLSAYHAAGALARAVVVLRTPNHVAVVEPASAQEH